MADNEGLSNVLIPRNHLASGVSSSVSNAVPAQQGSWTTFGSGNLGALAAGSQTATSGTVVFADSNGLAWGMSNSTQVTGSYSQSTHSHVTYSASASNGAYAFTTLKFVEGSGVTWATQAGGIQASVKTDYLTTAMASNRGTDFVQATAAFAGTSASGTINSTGISVSIGPYITTAMLSARGSDFVQATATIAGTSISGTIASNGLSLSVGPYLTTAMASNRETDFVQATAAFAGTNASGTINSTGISVSVSAPYIPVTLSYFENIDAFQGTQTMVVSQSTNYVQPFQLSQALTGQFLRIPVSVGMTSTSWITSNATRTGGFSRLESHNFVIYSQGAGASSNSLQYVTSTQGALTWGLSYSINSTRMSSTYTMVLQRTGSAGFGVAINVSESTDSYRLYTSVFSRFSGNRWWDIPFALSLPAGVYWLAHCISTSTSTQGATSSNLQGLSLERSIYAVSQVDLSLNIMGFLASTVQAKPGLGNWSTNSAGATTSSLDFTSMSTRASNPLIYFQVLSAALT